MSDSITQFDAKVDTATSGDVAKAVWDFMTSIKAVKKRDGSQQDFSAHKLKSSVVEALKTAGMKNEKKAIQIAENVLTRLTKKFDGHAVPRTADIADTINLTFIDHNLTHVSKRYLQHRTGGEIRKSEFAKYGSGIHINRYFSKPGVHPYDEIEWELRDAVIKNEKGVPVFEQKNVEIPKTWSQTATNIVVSKYFRGKVGEEGRETSIRQLIDRVANTITDWGRKDGYFYSSEDADIFDAELKFILVNQMAAFNSPVWFNVGNSEHPQCSACFINSVDDDMRSILNLCVTEGMLFKGGSGAGSNLSRLRSKQEFLGGSNGRASGPVSFMKGLDAFAGVIKSGGKTRRAAKMVILDIDHPDIEDFINCKYEEEKKAWALMDAGYDGSIDGPAYSSIYFQNANNSVRVTDEFMQAVENDEDWVTKEVLTKNPSLTYKARDLMGKISEAAWQCGDPGMQYDTTINKWHTCKNTDRIFASNPCSEYMFLDDTACNLASLNLLKYRKEVDGQMEFDTQAFKSANEIIITAMEVLISNASYPTPAIEQNSFEYRPLGIGYANLGALLMSRGLAYDSDEGRNLAGAITALQSGHCYYQSGRIAEKMGPFAGYKKNAEPAQEVMKMHRAAAYEMDSQGVPNELMEEAKASWDNVVAQTAVSGLRNAQISVLAPTGTIAFFMDCDTTGVEPDIALVKYKWLVGGGLMKIVNNTVPEALTRLGYTDEQLKDILAHIEEKDTIEGAPHFKDEHLAVFDCAFKAANGTRTIHYMGHLRMMAAVQPYLSGAISKTVNLPHDATVEDVTDVYMEGWKLGLKAIAIYRDGSKRQQALTTSKEKDAKKQNTTEKIEEVVVEKIEVVAQTAVSTPTVAVDGREIRKPMRRRLSDERRAITHKFSVGNHKGFITVGLYDDGAPGEVFITMSKEGSVIRGLMDSFATSISIGLQYGVPLQVWVNKFVHMRFEPSGYTNNPNIRIAKSIVDYVFRWMALKFLSSEEQIAVGINGVVEKKSLVETGEETEVLEDEIEIIEDTKQTKLFDKESGDDNVVLEVKESVVTLTATFDNHADAPACDTCGSMMVRNAACYKCLNCGGTSGCS